MVRKSYNSGSYVAYTYNAEGSLARLSYGDSTGELASYRFEYDSLGRLIRSAELDADGSTVQRTEHIYDGYNRLSRQSWTLGGKTYSESYVYDDPSDTNKNGDGALTQMTTATGAVIDYQYDTLRRLTRSEVALNGSTVYTTAYAFRDLDASRTTTQVQYRNVRNANGEVLEGKKYTYDALGNITRISQSTGHFYPLVAYEYDAQNQLTKETYYNGNGTAAGNITRTISYTYDTAGNILSETKTVGSKTTTKTFSYTDSNWKDLLTAVNGLSITYDASGNPETYYTGSVDRRGNAEVYDMYWGNGRQLTDVETDDGQTRSQISYGYDADGIRSWKAVDGEIHTYLTQGGKVMRETVGSTVMDFAYDESGKPFALNYSTNGGSSFTTYYYVLNLQGDVVKLVTASGTEAASYAYDAWGNLLSATGSMAYTNPLRYRGYYHDAETRFYYLQSRYYDPVYHRFINADNYASTGQGFLGTNMFAYCENNPSILRDDNGMRPKFFRDDSDDDNEYYIDPSKQPNPESGYVAPKKNPHPKKVKNPNGRGSGWPAQDGGVWVPDNNMDGGPGWVVQYPGGRHEHRYPNGKVRTHKTSDSTTAWYEYVGIGIAYAAGGFAIGALIVDNVIPGGEADDIYIEQIIEGLQSIGYR